MNVSRSCCLLSHRFLKFSTGTMITRNSVCVSRHISEWKTQSYDERMPWNNMFTARAKSFEVMNMQSFTKRTLTKLQTSYIVSAVEVACEKQQNSRIYCKTHTMWR